MIPANERRSAMEWVMPILVLAVAIVGLVWVRIGVRDLREACERREAELKHFDGLARELRLRPTRSLVAELRDCLREQRWHRSIRSARPTVVEVPAGMTLRFAPRERPGR